MSDGPRSLPPDPDLDVLVMPTIELDKGRLLLESYGTHMEFQLHLIVPLNDATPAAGWLAYRTSSSLGGNGLASTGAAVAAMALLVSAADLCRTGARFGHLRHMRKRLSYAAVALALDAEGARDG